MAMIIFGATVPYFFAALTMQSVGRAAQSMVEAVREDFERSKREQNYKPDTEKCIQIATNSSLTEMFLPGLIVIILPILTGILFGPKAVAGILIGIIISGIQIAISSANSGGAWDNAKKYIKSKFQNLKIIDIGLPVTGKEKYEIERKDLIIKLKVLEANKDLNKDEIEQTKLSIVLASNQIKRLENDPSNEENRIIYHIKDKRIESYRHAEEASIIGDTVGDPLKDTSGPSLNILIKLTSVISVVFGTLFVNTSYLIQ